MNGRSCVRDTGQVGFADLVLADQGWLDAEFDAIVAANFGAYSTPRPWFTERGPSGAFRGPDRSAGPRARPAAHAAHRVDPRERSPPPRRIDGG
ncbi:hypothetical protein [Saccharothrix sp. ALI-22-I]|uniref:hypothetical protein n=1 Tax=Saccharothrix sp. ALI-22-I TaxID=1933778 RepID=UPI00117A136E|nr:hypothetical protein [Saccharothrix sp. ALI-22-I]